MQAYPIVVIRLDQYKEIIDRLDRIEKILTREETDDNLTEKSVLYRLDLIEMMLRSIRNENTTHQDQI